MAQVTKGGTLPDSAAKTDFYTMVDSATVTGIVNADIASNAAIADTKLAQITTTNKVNVSAITGTLPVANGGTGSATQNYVDLTTNQTIAGVKTFNSFPVTPETTTITGNYTVTNVGYVNAKTSFGTWVDKSSEYNTAQTASTDGLVLGSFIFSDVRTITAKTDSNSDPSTIVIQTTTTNGGWGAVMFPVKKNDKWKIIHDSSPTNKIVYWLPSES